MLLLLEAISKKGFWFKIPSSPKGYAGQARRGSEDSIPPEKGGRPKDFFEIASRLCIPAAVEMGVGMKPSPSPTHQYLQHSNWLANYDLICY